MRLNKKISPFENLIYTHYRITHALRIMLAFVLTFMIIRLLAVPEGTWPLITLVVVMGPISYWGNVFPRAIQRIFGTVFGSISGLIALYLETYSLTLMLVWCGIVMFLCGYLTMGKHPYMALLIGITLAVVCGSAPGDMDTALWRSGDVIFGSLLALVFTSIYPQRAFIQWRMQMSDNLQAISHIYAAYLSPNVVERPSLELKLNAALNRSAKMRSLITPSSKESHINKDIFDSVQILSRNLICTLGLLVDAYWSSRESHLVMLNAPGLRDTQLMTINCLNTLSHGLRDGSPAGDSAVAAELKKISSELKSQLLALKQEQQIDTPVYGYVWLSMELTKQLEELDKLINITLSR
ncbi:fusaric acid resistance family protein [Yersinia rohdei]|uniref:Fusaric acid resistance family protein n=1 Tax=Yersinia rohdei TaxID=29485 RepID=A0ABN4FAV4_YERRO|nr:FUSC family protein [Yersinia rohdei]AJJ11103.1 fusaric acid resistance family protein [Yersinia rohdei]EEQ04127.1 Inner membrane protein yeeA [Yersinia rohdei ATCC 43380]MDN0094508.1 FUSC family protein [Yersinia rohdei]OWF81733.1 FUSC family protein [Yersinia rohdei]CNE14233.1 putative inner membrane protein [Yersinia rohdei]